MIPPANQKKKKKELKKWFDINLIELPLPLAEVHLLHTGESLKCSSSADW